MFFQFSSPCFIISFFVAYCKRVFRACHKDYLGIAQADYIVGPITVSALIDAVNKKTQTNSADNNSASTLQDVTKDFAGKTIAIKSKQNGNYCSADTNYSGTPVIANRSVANTWEYFKVSNLTSDGWVGIKGHNDKYLSSSIDLKGAPIRSTADKLLSWECFKIYKSGSDYYIYSQSNKKYLTAMVNLENTPLQAQASTPSTWERFNIQIVRNC